MASLPKLPVLPAVASPERIPWPPVEPPPALARFPDPSGLGDEWVVGVTRTLGPALVLQAYREGIFPWPTSRSALIPWASPEPRTVFPLEQAGRWPRSVQRDLKRAAEGRWQVTFDQAYAEVMRGCAERPREGTWITPELYAAYVKLHELGWGHSVEVWRPHPDGGRELVGGLYGLAVGALFAGESMFHRESGASKVAFARMAEHLAARGFDLFDVQAHSEHLASLGCIDVPRVEFLRRLKRAIARPVPFTRRS